MAKPKKKGKENNSTPNHASLCKNIDISEILKLWTLLE
jgi:hypothetical protein